MTVTPSDIFRLALERHRMPWNWTLHAAAIFGFGLTLLLHSPLMLSASLILLGTGFFDIKMPEMPDGRWRRLVLSAVEWEKNWVAAPWNRYKWWRFLFVLAVSLMIIWALWTRDLAAIGLLVGFGYLIRVMRENIEGGVDP